VRNSAPGFFWTDVWFGKSKWNVLEVAPLKAGLAF